MEVTPRFSHSWYSDGNLEIPFDKEDKDNINISQDKWPKGNEGKKMAIFKPNINTSKTACIFHETQ